MDEFSSFTNDTEFKQWVNEVSSTCGKNFGELKDACDKPSEVERNNAVKKWIDSIEKLVEKFIEEFVEKLFELQTPSPTSEV